MQVKFKKQRCKHSEKKEWRVQFKKNGSVPFSGGYINFSSALRGFFKGWIYTFKYPRTLTPFWKQLFQKLIYEY